MTFREKINKLLATNTLGIGTINALEKKLGVGVGSISKPYRKEDSPGLEIIKKIKEFLRVNDAWWDTGSGPIFKDEQKNFTLTDVDSKKPESIYQDFIENNTEYRLVPKTILDGEYRVVPNSSIKTQDRLIDQLTMENERLWKLLEEYKLRETGHPKNA